jgi:hypothetical protein
MAALSLLLVLAACGGGSDESPKTPATSAPAASQPAGEPTVAAPSGDPIPQALSRFRCEPDGAGTFQASGVLANSTKAKVNFQVTVFVGEPPAAPLSAKTKQIPSIAGGGSVEFTVYKIPSPPEGGTCHVQVLTTK